MSEQQTDFDKTYITSIEICDRLGVKRSTLLQARSRGKLPEPITIKRHDGTAHVMLWRRAVVEPLLNHWDIEIRAWRAARA